MKDKSLGVFCKKDKNFYYLETGSNHIPNTVPRLTKALIARNLIVLDDENPYTTSQYEVFSIKEAKEKELNLVPIFFNTHIKKFYEQKKNEKESSKWK